LEWILISEQGMNKLNNRMEKKMFFVIFAVTALFFGACKILSPNKAGKASNYEGQDQKAEITEKYWKLTELMGKPINKDVNKEPYIILKAENQRLKGTGGCNSLNGSYELKENGRISFSRIATTRMACQDMETEIALLKVLETEDSYSVKNDTLILNRGRMAPLARFEAVYMN